MSDTTWQTIDTSTLRERVHADRIAPSLYYDPNLFEAELERIFYKTWVWVAHESELPNPGDFRTTTIGRQPVIVVRDKTGAVNVLQNRCRHRGATVCEEHKGNAKGFTCPYHSWSYALDGTLRALPYGDGYEGVCEKGDLPLAKLRVGIYQGLIFASFDENVEPLEDFLGGAKRSGSGAPSSSSRSISSGISTARLWPLPSARQNACSLVMKLVIAAAVSSSIDFIHDLCTTGK